MPEASYTLQSETAIALVPSPAEFEVTDLIGSGLEAAGMHTAHAEEALNHLLHQFQGKPRLGELVSLFVAQVQALEEAFWALYTLRTLDAATGAQLDGLGAVVGEPRRGRTDTAYRQFIRVRILVNRASGTLEDFWAILRGVFGETLVALLWEYFPAQLVIHLDTPLAGIEPVDVWALVKDAKPTGVMVTLIAGSDAHFVFATGTGVETSATQGWGSTTSETMGGNLAPTFI